MSPDTWFAELLAHLPGGAAPTEAETAALLDLARVAAHTSERWAAPVSTFVVGAALADVAPEERAARIRALTAELEGRAEGST
jgi:hypothetical protein